MTEKTARLGTTTLHIQHDHELEPDMLRIQLENDHGTESWTQTVERVARALKRESARADFDFRGEDQHVRLVIGTDGGFVEVEDPGGDITEHEFTAYELSRALYETGARDPLPHEVLVPELARVARALAGDGRRLLVGPLSQSSSKPCAGTLLVERDGLAAEVAVVRQPLYRCYRVAMPIHPSHQHGSRVLLEDHDVLFGDNERTRLVEAVERALVQEAYGIYTYRTHRNNGLRKYHSRHQNLVPLAGEDDHRD